MSKRAHRFWKEYGVPFLFGFALVSIFFLVTHPWSNAKKLPALAIVLSPHFDDAALSLGGVMAEKKSPIIVATFFTGKPQSVVSSHWDAISGFKNSDEALRERKRENIEALSRAGAYPLDLQYLDFQYDSARDETSRQNAARSMEKDLEIMLESFKGVETISVYGPSQFGPVITHPDHQILHDAFMAVARRYGAFPNLRFFFYEDFPYVARYDASTTTPLKTFLEKNNHDVSLREIPLPVSSLSLNKKIDSIKAYSSQEKAFESLGDNIAEEARTFTKARCKKANPAWRGCEVVYEMLK